MRLSSIFIALLLSISSIACAQSGLSSNDSVDLKNAVSIVPQYAAISGIRIDYERKIKNDRWLLFAPQLYLNKDGNNDYGEMTGLGINVYYKLFLSHSKKKNANGLSRTNIYFSVGPTFQHLNLTSVEELPVEFIQDGVTYIRFTSDEVTTRINKFGANADFGLQFAFERFLLDIYAGIGIRYAVDKDGNLMDFYNSSWLDYGYSGILLDGGIRFGFFIP